MINFDYMDHPTWRICWIHNWTRMKIKSKRFWIISRKATEQTKSQIQEGDKNQLLRKMRKIFWGKKSVSKEIWFCKATLCSRNFQNVKLRLDFVEIWSFYCYSDFTWNQILSNSNSPKMLFFAILEVLNFAF